jgi:hypothetical protein
MGKFRDSERAMESEKGEEESIVGKKGLLCEQNRER